MNTQSDNKNESFFKKCGRNILEWVKKHWLLLLTLLFVILSVILILHAFRCIHLCFLCHNTLWAKFFLLAYSLLFVLIVMFLCNRLTNKFILKREESKITICQIVILVAIGLWIIGAILIIDVQKDTALATALAVIGSVLMWIFQDRIKGAFAFIEFRRNKLLNIDDWIQVPKLGVDGEIKKVTLTTVTLYNWDTTTSTIPISALQSEHFINLQNMSDGKTYGRRMLAEFTIDTGWIHPFDADEVKSFLSEDHNINAYLPEEEVKEGVLNAQLYRLYIYHWLMANDHVSQRPRLLVRWMEQKDSGMVLQVYAFLTDYDFSAFEWQKSQIVEHIIQSMKWFGCVYTRLHRHMMLAIVIFILPQNRQPIKLKKHEKQRTNR